MTQISEAWNELKKNQGSEGIVQIRVKPDAPCNLFVAIEKPSNRLCFILEAHSDTIFDGTAFEQSEGYSVEMEQLKKGSHGNLRIIFRCKQPEYNDIFSALVTDIIETIRPGLSEKQSIQEISKRLHTWMTFMKKHGLKGLDEKEQQGLYGELCFLKSTIIPIVGSTDGIKFWVGPKGKNQDFHLKGISVEVKTTSSNPHEIIRISNLRQLEAPNGVDLFLLHIQMDIRIGDSRTLPELVQEIRSICAFQGTIALNEFNERLIDLGYLDEHIEKYSNTQYSVKRENFYLIKEGFPRLTTSALPNGVGDVKYSIAVSACSDYLKSKEDFVSKLGGKKHV